jgi:hypothetical protein
MCFADLKPLEQVDHGAQGSGQAPERRFAHRIPLGFRVCTQHLLRVPLGLCVCAHPLLCVALGFCLCAQRLLRVPFAFGLCTQRLFAFQGC